MTLQALPSVIFSEIRTVFYQVISTQNWKAPIAKLPDDILIHSLKYLSLYDRIRACQVCQLWREIFLDAPSYWADVSSKVVRRGALKPVLQRSRKADLTLELHIREQNAEEVYLSLVVQLHRCKTLRLHFAHRSGSLSDSWAKEITTMLCDSSASRLESLQIIDRGAAFNAESTKTLCLFAGRTPSLVLVKMHVPVDAFESSGDAFYAVTSLMLINSVHRKPSVTLNDALKLFPNLERLSFGFDEEDVRDEQDNVAVLLPSKLRALALMCGVSNVNYIGALLLRMSYHACHRVPRSLRHICITFDQKSPVNSDFRILDSLQQSCAEEFSRAICLQMDLSHARTGLDLNLLWMDDDASGIQDWRLANAQQRLRSMRNVPHTVDLPLDFASSIVWLSIGELILTTWTPNAEYPDGQSAEPINETCPLPTMIALKHLAIQTLLPEYSTKDSFKSVFFLPRNSNHVLRCPVLETFTIAAPRSGDLTLSSCGGTTWIGPDCVRDYIEWHLDYDQQAAPTHDASRATSPASPRKLSKLVFRGARIHESAPVGEIAKLLQLADGYVFEPGFYEQPDELEWLLEWD